MSGDNKNARLLTHVDVFIAALGSTVPAAITDPFAAAWDQCGLIADEKIDFSRDWGKDDDFYDFDGALVASLQGQYKEQVKFSFLEDSTKTRKIMFPGSSDTAIMVPRSVPLLFALDLYYQVGDHERLITKKHALIDVAGWSMGQELTKFPATAKIFPDTSVAGNQLWIRQFQKAT